MKVMQSLWIVIEAITENRERAKAWFFASVGVTCKDYIEVC